MNYPTGAILRRRLGGLLGWFAWHWGIYTGDGHVVHFNGQRKNATDAILQKQSLADFQNGYRLSIHQRPENQAHATAVCEKAYRLLKDGANRFNGSYDFVFNNCQSFCACCYDVDYR